MKELEIFIVSVTWSMDYCNAIDSAGHHVLKANSVLIITMANPLLSLQLLCVLVMLSLCVLLGPGQVLLKQ